MDDATIAPASKYAAQTEWGLKSLKDKSLQNQGSFSSGTGQVKTSGGKIQDQLLVLLRYTLLG